MSKSCHATLLRRLGLTAAATAALALAACGNEPESRTAGEQVDATIAAADDAAREAGDRIADGMNRMGEAVDRAAGAAGDAVGNAAVTAAVNAALAADSELSMLAIDVDADNGMVVLSGTAPNAAARERASALALGVDGVSAVDNRLTVPAS